MSRVIFLSAGGAAILASYLVVIFGPSPADTFGSATLAGIALPALVSGFVITAYIAMEAKRVRDGSGLVGELHAQLARKEIQISRLSTIDELTGLHTRHHFDDNVQLEFARSKRHDRPLAVLLIEIDDLTDVDEQMGALSTGYLLSEVGALLRTTLRLTDIGCRYTNDKLAALLPETAAQHAGMVAEKLRELVARRAVDAPSAGRRAFTISQGIAVLPSPGMRGHSEFLRAAEAALSEAKAAGRDEVHIAIPPPTAASGPPDLRIAS